ncbi:MAG: 3-oxoacyl-ACP reductase FabG [Actinomycetota bacterium]
MADLGGRVALVTGGGRGIGAATSRRFGREGAALVLAALESAPGGEVRDEIVATGGRALAVSCDVTSREDVEAAVSRAVGDFGSLDILVTCAGITRDNLIHKLSDEDWDSVIRTHLTGTFLCAQAAQREMVARKRGAMVFLSSGSARGNRGQANYSAAKSGIEGLARTLAIELGRFDIRVNVVAPGFIDTRMTRAIAERTGQDYGEITRAYAERLPLGRVGQADEIASVIAFFCGDDSGYVTGQTLHVRGAP